MDCSMPGSFVLCVSGSLLRFMFIESVMPSSYLILCYPLFLSPSVFASIRSFPVSWLFASGGQSIVASASASVLVNIQGWFPWGLTGWVSLQSKWPSGVFSNTTRSQIKQLRSCLHISYEFSVGDITPCVGETSALCLSHRSVWCTDYLWYWDFMVGVMKKKVSRKDPRREGEKAWETLT